VGRRYGRWVEVRRSDGVRGWVLAAQVVPINQLMRGVSLLATTGRLADVLGAGLPVPSAGAVYR